MMRARRLAAVAVGACLAVAGLTACSAADPQVAIYYGGKTELTNDRVDQILADAHAKAQSASGQAGQAAAPQFTRPEIVQVVLMDDLFGRVLSKQGVAPPTDAQLDPTQIASQLGVAANSDIALLYARFQAEFQALQQSAKPGGKPSDADLQQIFSVLTAAHDVTGSFAKFKSGLQDADLQTVSAVEGLRDQIQSTAIALKVKVNPEYGPMKFTLLPISQSDPTALLQATLTGIDLTGPVTDLPTDAPSAS